ncbi:hypothetical protein M5X11_15080 [Paenibacillus alginolyticus]|uniref:hypothetical protein n=1 Tax=Paenibacillus alginolyticus TaxID=59839 RepID=UPI000418275D|nr:hypothetical protein [Paenibacillus alginolyticus]MCY9666268.1 hypothetical protein [Paenibacillus alginolyticus]
MRKMSLSDIQAKLTASRSDVDHAVSVFHGKTKDEGWIMKRMKPRDPDKIKSLNYLARSQYRKAVQDGTIHYDKERRVLTIAKYLRS